MTVLLVSLLFLGVFVGQAIFFWAVVQRLERMYEKGLDSVVRATEAVSAKSAVDAAHADAIRKTTQLNLDVIQDELAKSVPIEDTGSQLPRGAIPLKDGRVIVPAS